MRRPFAAALLAALLAPPVARAAPPDAPALANRVYLIGPLSLRQPHFRLDDGSDAPVLFLSIQNRSHAPDRLLAVTVDGADATTLAGVDADGSLLIPPMATVALGPAGSRVVTSGWINPGAADGRLGATLRFARAGAVRVSLRRDTGGEAEPPPAPVEAEKAIDLAR